IRVYDCRPLLDVPRPRGSVSTKVARGGGGFFAIQDEPARKSAPEGSPDPVAPPAADGGSRTPQTHSAAGGSFGDGGAEEKHISDAENLIQLITTIVDPESWNEVGGPGAIAEYKGLVSVDATQKVHEKVERLLNMLPRAPN